MSLSGLAPQAAGLAGIVVDEENRPTSGALVLVTDAASGIPVNSKGQSFLTTLSGKLDLAGARTDPAGRFQIDIPPGRYTVHAQRWVSPDHRWDSGFPGPPLQPDFGDVVALHGSARDVDVPSSRALELQLSPPGRCALSLDLKFGNDGAFLVASQAPPPLDPIFGFRAWNDQFLTAALAMNRMPAGRTTLLNLPEGTIHLAVFANDNNPGFGSAEVAVEPGRTAVVDMKIVASWSNGHHLPPARLQPLSEKIRANGWTTQHILASTGTSETRSLDLRRGGPNLDRILADGGRLQSAVPLPDATSAPLVDVLTVLAYHQLQADADKIAGFRSNRTIAPKPDK